MVHSCSAQFHANSQLYPLAFGVVDGDCHASWIWFLRKLIEAIGEDVQDLTFISARHDSIIHGVEVVFHGIPHLRLNVQHKFNTDHFWKLRRKDVEMPKYLEEVNFDRWPAKVLFPGKR